MDKTKKEYGVAYKNAKEVLSNYVDYFRIFPSYFLEMVNNENVDLYSTFEQGAIAQNLDSKNFENMMKEQIEKYIDSISSIEDKSKFISAWKNYEDPLAFFQYVMSKEDLRNIAKKLQLEELKKANELVKAKQVTGDQAAVHFGFNKNNLQEFEKQMRTSFEMGDR